MPARVPDLTLEPVRLSARLDALPAASVLRRLRDGTRPVYLVGGAVRDLALDRTPAELDLLVEDDADGLARALAGGVAGAVRVFPRFGTATVTVAGRTYDIARARTERYPAPGALPEVTPARAQEDLRRRDFTVNAIALGIGGPSRDRLLSVPGAAQDLAAGRLRVLHADSFRDDPTRLLRLARYAARLEFSVEPATRELALAAAAQGALDTVSGTRIGAELVLLAGEPDPVTALGLLQALGAGDALAPGFGIGDPDGARRGLALLPAPADRAAAVLGAALLGVPAAARGPLLDRLGLAAGRRHAIGAIAAGAPELARALSGARTPSQIAAAVGRAPPEAVALAGGLDRQAEPAARAWLQELRHVTLSITGNDLIAAGVPAGPAIGAGLAAARAAVMDGRAMGREAELSVALRAALA
ncbi:MAG TPA: hypothetical protein VFN55_00685 [Solirubrobacteraceae bacterium]|nr:hypothetical protein [Solirubrobacteraceae bacterium]